MFSQLIFDNMSILAYLTKTAKRYVLYIFFDWNNYIQPLHVTESYFNLLGKCTIKWFQYLYRVSQNIPIRNDLIESFHVSESYPHVLGKCTIKGFQYFYKVSQIILIRNDLTYV